VNSRDKDCKRHKPKNIYHLTLDKNLLILIVASVTRQIYNNGNSNENNNKFYCLKRNKTFIHW
jgi:hypothetical protein